MTNHITGVVGHWRGQIGAWDVVNEALADGNRDGRRHGFQSASLRCRVNLGAMKADFL